MLRVIVIFLFATPALSQTVQNPSFEGFPGQGVVPSGWKLCNLWSTPDTQPGQWGVNTAASHGSTYISLFARGTGGFVNDNTVEAIQTSFSSPLNPQICYSLSLDLAFFPEATFYDGWGQVIVYDNPLRLLVWGGHGECEKEILLYQSPLITHKEWQTYSFPVAEANGITNLTLEVDYPGSPEKYGNILIDNLVIKANAVDLGADQFVCPGSTATLIIVQPEANVLWNTGSTAHVLTVDQEGTYSVKVENGGCVVRDSVVIYYPKLEFELGKDTILCPGNVLILNAATTNGSYTWSTGTTEANLTVISEGNYSVNVQNGCETRSDNIEVKFDKTICCSLQAPNFFSPDGNGLNDSFEFLSEANLRMFNLVIYDRWGGVIFRSNEIQDTWKGIHASAGVYFWTASIVCENNDRLFENSFRGVVTLQR